MVKTVKPIRIEKWGYRNVRPDGSTPDDGPGTVETKKFVRTSASRGGCGLAGCGCSPGHWISISSGRKKDGTMSGKTLYFKNRADLLEYRKGMGGK